MKRRKAFGPGRGLAGLALFTATLWAGTATAQNERAAQSAAEQRRAEERDARQRELAVPDREVRPDTPKATPAPRLPVDESPCFTIHQIDLHGAGASPFA